jgi:hypothetical protein
MGGIPPTCPESDCPWDLLIMVHEMITRRKVLEERRKVVVL